MTRQAEHIRVAILLPIALALVFLLTVMILFTYLQEHEHIDNDVRKTIRSVEIMFQQEVHNRETLLWSLLGQLGERADLQQAFLRKDREALQALAQPLFDTLRSQYHVTHMYFIDDDRTCFLRMHMPQFHGDLIDRHTAVQASETGEKSQGMELGPLGTFVLRVVQPWVVQGKRVGYLEISEDLDDISRTLAPVFSADFLVLIDKRFLDREKWEQGLQSMGRKSPGWNALPEDVVMLSTLPGFPLSLSDRIRQARKDPGQTILALKEGDRSLRGGLVPLRDSQGRRAGNLLVLEDITRRLASIRSMSVKIAILGLVAGTLLFAFFLFYVGGIQKRLVLATESLKNMFEQQLRTEQELRSGKEFLDLAIESVNHPFMVIDAENYQVLRANAAARQFSRGEVKYCYNLNHDRDQPCREPEHRCPLQEVKRTGRPAHVEHIHYLSDGSPRIVEIQAFPVRAPDGGVSQIIECAMDITEHKKMQQKIEASLQEKELLLKEIHHRVRNNMQAIYGLLELQSGFVQDPVTVSLFKESQNRILSMAMVHEQLYQQPDLAHIRMQTYLEDLSRKVLVSLRGTDSEIRLETDIQDVTFEVGTAMPCGIIVNELVSNALKHAFPQGLNGTIRVGLRSGPPDVFELTVSDNGVGLPDNSTYSRAETFGMQMLKAFGEDELGGTVELEREEGTTFRIRFRAERAKDLQVGPKTC